MKIFFIQIKIGFLMLLAIILVSATGYLSYRNLSSIVSSIRVDLEPEQRLLIIREISMDLEKAQNSIRIFTITKDTLYLKPYYTIISNIDGKVKRLVSECRGDTILLQQTDTISNLIEENIVNWNELLYLNNNQKVDKYLKELSDRLNSGPEEILQTENGILKRVLIRNDKSRLNEKELITDLQEIELQDRIMKEKMMIREAQLAATGTKIKEQFNGLTVKIENEISDLITKKALAADELAHKTYIWLASFSFLGTLLAILVMFIVARFVKKTNDYQKALQNSKNEAEQLSRTKELFMANMSHEIRTPITAISGFTEQLLHEPFDENTTRALKIIKSSSDHLGNIVNDILDFSKLQNGNLELEKVHFSIRQILEDVYALFEKQAIRNNTRLSFSLNPETPQVLLGDPYRLKQIMINLVSNSVKFTKNGQVHFSVKGVQKNSTDVDLEMEFVDTGIGIDESKLNLIFEDFTQEEMSTAREYGGTGLGLSIVKKLIELHKGTIECKSRKNYGTSISCFIRYKTGDENEVKKDVDRPLYIPEEIRDLKILIVDDEEYNRLLFRTIMERWKIKYHEAASGFEALDSLKTNNFDLMFMDVRMPGIDGLKVTQIIRGEMNIRESEMPVICISAVSVNEDWQKYREAGMNAFLPKPFTEEMLLTTIISVIKDYAPVANTRKVSEKIIRSDFTDKINLQNLYHFSDNDEQFVKQMLVSFVDTTEKGLKEMHEDLIAGQSEMIAELAHKMLPPCRHIGASVLCIILKKIEEEVNNKSSIEQIQTLIVELTREYDIVSELIKESIAKIS